jgi:hypothetical protein
VRGRTPPLVRISRTPSRAIQVSGRGGGEGPEREGDYEPSARASANECEAPQEGRSAGAHADFARRDDEGARVPKPHVDARVRGARSNAYSKNHEQKRRPE